MSMLKALLFALALVASVPSFAQTRTTETARAILNMFDHYPVVAIGEERHGKGQNGDFYVALIHDPLFGAKVNNVVLECGNQLYQPIIDRYVNGEAVPVEELAQVWRNTTQIAVWDSPVYQRIIESVREVNQHLAKEHRIRVLAGDPPLNWAKVATLDDYKKHTDRETPYAEVIEREVLSRHQTALVIIGRMHFTKSGGVRGQPNVRTMLEKVFPGREYLVSLFDGGEDPAIKALFEDLHGPILVPTEQPEVAAAFVHFVSRFGAADVHAFCDRVLFISRPGRLAYPSVAELGDSYMREMARRIRIVYGPEWRPVFDGRMGERALVMKQALDLAAGSKTALDLPAPTGEYAVGRKSFFWVDRTRKDVTADGPPADRELMVYLYYPVDRTAAKEPASWFPDLSLASEKLGPDGLKKIFKFAFEGIWTARAHSYENAPPCRSCPRLPVLIFSHGMGQTPLQYSSLIEDVASHGYVVAAISHTHGAGVVVFPNQRLVPFSMAMERLVKDKAQLWSRVTFWSADQRFVADQLEKLNSGALAESEPLKGRLDLRHIGAFGHSYGGIAAFYSCSLDSRVVACLNGDGGTPDLFRKHPWAKANTPFMMIDPKHPAEGTWIDSALRESSGGAYRVVFDVPGGFHGNFNDNALMDPNQDFATAESRRRAMEIIRSYTRAFFDKVLLGSGSTLLDRASSDYPDVQLLRFGPAHVASN